MSFGGDFTSLGRAAVECCSFAGRFDAEDGFVFDDAVKVEEDSSCLFADGLKKLNIDPFTGTAADLLCFAVLADASAKKLCSSSSTDWPPTVDRVESADVSVAFIEAV